MTLVAFLVHFTKHLANRERQNPPSDWLLILTSTNALS